MAKNNLEIRIMDIAEFFAREDAEQLMIDNYNADSIGLFEDKLNPNVEKYIQLQAMGVVDCVVVLDDWEIVGFMIVIHNEMLHFTRISTVVESLYVRPDCRKFGTGKRLMEYATELAKIRGSVAVYLSATANGRLEKVAKGFGFTKCNTIFGKAIK